MIKVGRDILVIYILMNRFILTDFSKKKTLCGERRNKTESKHCIIGKSALIYMTKLRLNIQEVVKDDIRKLFLS